VQNPDQIWAKNSGRYDFFRTKHHFFGKNVCSKSRTNRTPSRDTACVIRTSLASAVDRLSHVLPQPKARDSQKEVRMTLEARTHSMSHRIRRQFSRACKPRTEDLSCIQKILRTKNRNSVDQGCTRAGTTEIGHFLT
jgi:hypothetical protein